MLSTHSLPLVVDLDGTLIQTDVLVESGVAFARLRPLQVWRPFVWLKSGKARLKAELARVVELDVTTLPYNPQVIALIERERALGRTIVLATASHRRYAEQVAAHLALFDHVLASEGEVNLSALRKRDALVELFGQGGFDYVGNSDDDVPVWQTARLAYVVNPERGVEGRARAVSQVFDTLVAPKNTARSWFKALRFHQWLKNLLIFVPLLASHQGSAAQLLDGVWAFLAFGLCASSVYVLNDVLDVQDDRHHLKKRLRPFASGQLSLLSGLMVCPVLLGAAFALAWWLPPMFSATLLTYYGLTLAYSLKLKRHMAIDVIVLALLYTLRIVAGVFAFSVQPTFWMLAFSMFVFLSLALVKRFAELREQRVLGWTEKSRGRGYYPDDLEMISALGASSGYLSVLVLALYAQDPNTMKLYAHPQVIWLACPVLLLWMTRVWLITHRGQMHDDPVVFAAKDRFSWLVGAVFVALFWLAS